MKDMLKNKRILIGLICLILVLVLAEVGLTNLAGTKPDDPVIDNPEKPDEKVDQSEKYPTPENYTKNLKYTLVNNEGYKVSCGEAVKSFSDNIIYIPPSHLDETQSPEELPVIEIDTKGFAYDKDDINNCNNIINRIILPSSIRKIGSAAFKDCQNLEEINISRSCTTIDNLAFEGCKKLKSLSFSNLVSLTNIASDAFNDTPLLTEAVSGPLYIATVLFAYIGEESGELIVKEGTLRINDYACQNKKITKVTFPKSLKYIGEAAFSGTLISELTIPRNIETISKNAFSDITTLTSLTIEEGIKVIADYAFRNTKITKVTIPESLTELGSYLFAECKGLSEVRILARITALNEFTFANCTNLKTITLPISLVSIANNCFANNSSLTGISIPGSIKEIGIEAFANCHSVVGIELPSTLTKVGQGAFSGWSKNQIIDIYLSAEEASKFNPNWQDGCNASISYRG